jgi:hypothetical protein
MSNDNKLPCLPQNTTDQLVALKGTSTEDFYALVKALRTEGWPLRAIAEPFSVSRTAVQGWEQKYEEGTPLPEVPTLPVVPRKERKNSSKKYTLAVDEIKDLQHLANLASTVRRYTDPNSTSRKAAAELEQKLIEYSDRGISRTQLAKYCGVSDSSIKQRLRKYS